MKLLPLRRERGGFGHEIPADAGIMLIHSVDALGSERDIEEVGPFGGERRRPLPGQWEEIEGDEGYELDYLAREFGDYRYFRAEDNPTNLEPCPDPDCPTHERPPDELSWGVRRAVRQAVCDDCWGTGTSPPTGEGRHRKWQGILTRDEWIDFAYERRIDLDENFLPERHESTMGILGLGGLIGAIAIDDTEGWDPHEVIQSQFYMAIHVPPTAWEVLCERARHFRRKFFRNLKGTNHGRNS